MMESPATKKRKVSAGHGNSVYPQYTVENVSRDSSDLEGENVRRNGSIPDGHTNIQARAKAQKSSSYASNMFKLKINELLRKLRPDYEGRMVKLDSLVRRLKEVIERIPEREAKPVCDVTFVPIQSLTSV